MVELEDVKFNIIGDTSGVDQAVSKTTSSMKSLGSSLTTLGAGLTAGVTVPLMAIGALALKSASDVGGAFNTIKKETLATGKELESLQNTFKTVFSTVPVDASAAATAISTLHQKTQLLGPDLDALTIKFINLSRITGTDLTTDITQATEAFSAWSISAADTSSKLEEVWKVSTIAKIPLGELLDDLKQYAPVLQAFNLGFDDSVLLIGNLKTAGIEVTPVLNGLRTWMGKVATQADSTSASVKKVPTSFDALYNSIKNATTSEEAFIIATDAFGGRAAPTMVKAIRDECSIWISSGN